MFRAINDPLCSIGCFTYFGLNMILRKSPQTMLAEKYQNYPDYFNITKENFFFAFGIQDSTKKFIIDESIYTTKMSVIKIFDKQRQEETTVEVSQCESEDMPINPDLTEYFQVNPIINMFCIKNYKPVEMEGSEDSNFFEYLKVWIEVCVNETSSVACKSTYELDAFFMTSRFYVALTPYAVDSLDYETPLNQHGAFLAMAAQLKQKAIMDLNFQHLYIYTDDGIVFEETHLQRGINLNEHQNSYFLRNNQSDPLVELNIQLDKVVKIYERKYDKLQDILANTGGAIKILLIAFIVLTQPIVYFNFYKDLGNEYFDFNMDPKQKDNREPLNLGPFQYFFSFCGRKESEISKKVKLFEISKKILSTNLSLSQILKKQIELEKLKFLLFDTDQLVLFEYIPKPVLSDTKESEEITKNTDLRSLNSPVKNALQKKQTINEWNDTFFEINLLKRKGNIQAAYAYQHIGRKVVKTELDKRILDLTNFVDFFGKYEKNEKKEEKNEEIEEVKDEENSKNEGNFNEISLDEAKNVNPVSISLPVYSSEMEILTQLPQNKVKEIEKK